MLSIKLVCTYAVTILGVTSLGVDAVTSLGVDAVTSLGVDAATSLGVYTVPMLVHRGEYMLYICLSPSLLCFQ